MTLSYNLAYLSASYEALEFCQHNAISLNTRSDISSYRLLCIQYTHAYMLLFVVCVLFVAIKKCGIWRQISTPFLSGCIQHHHHLIIRLTKNVQSPRLLWFANRVACLTLHNCPIVRPGGVRVIDIIIVIIVIIVIIITIIIVVVIWNLVSPGRMRRWGLPRTASFFLLSTSHEKLTWASDQMIILRLLR